MLLAALPLFQPLFLQALPHGSVHFITCAEELQDTVLCVALPQLRYQNVTLISVQVRGEVRVHAELRA